jgi:imidazolonepropionase
LSNSHGAALAAKYRALSADHLEHLDEPGAKAMAASGTVAVLLPGAFYALQEEKKPPVELLRKHKVPIAIATDCNPGTSPLLSPTLAINMACTLFGLTPEEAIAGMTVNAARALGLAHSIGSIAAGKQADLCVWRIESLSELGYWIGLPGPERRIFGGIDT